jgi:ferritin-like metal-binding protein YciE
MPVNSLADLFHDTLRDVLYAEKKLTKALPKMAKNATNGQLAEAFTNHLRETEGHVDRLEQIFEMIGKTPRGKKCPAMDGLVEEGGEVMEEADDDATRDAGIIAAAQAVEHYEIARYGALAAWAKLLGEDDAVELLNLTLGEEKNADALLNQISEQINPMAEEKAAA